MPSPSTETPLNLLFVFSDQQAFDMLGCSGNPQIQTPRLDEFATQGMQCTGAFANSPLCTPCRGTLLTGLHPLYHGAVDNDWPVLPQPNVFGHILFRAGYQTGYIGKWHLMGGYRDQPVPDGPSRLGFDTFLSNNCDVDFRPGHAFYFDPQTGEKHRFEQWEQEAQTDQAIAFLRQVNQEPFALFVSLHPPHDHIDQNHHASYLAPEEWLARYPLEDIRLRPGVPDTPTHRMMQQGHMALCSSVDACFGRLMGTLDELGLSENTLVVYTSDHGDLLRWAGSERLIKSRPDPLSSHVPLLLRLPGSLSEGSVHDSVITHLDLMPTLLGLLGLTPPNHCQGMDFSTQLGTPNSCPPEGRPLFLQNVSFNWRGVVTDQYLYAWDKTGLPPEEDPLTTNVLFDWRHDPFGQHNLWSDAKLVDIRRHLHQLTTDWMDHFGDPYLPTAELLSRCYPELGGTRADVPWDDPDISLIPQRRPIDNLLPVSS